MTVGHLLLAAGMSAYMLIAIQLEERNLVDTFGADYLAYRDTTPMLVPGTGRRKIPS
jgi:protein-S-isoprenylcysteine O-methyltransferase Ste14